MLKEKNESNVSCSSLQEQDALNGTRNIVKLLYMYSKTIVYLHGLSSSGQSGTGMKIKKLFPENCVITPDIPVNPREALPYLKRILSKYKPEDTVIIGTSMGGMYAQQMTGFKRILVNPAFHVSNTLKKNIGENLPFFSPRQDGATEFKVTERLVKKFEEMEAKQFDNAIDPENVIALFGTRDTTVNCKDEYLKYYNNFIDFDGQHRLTDRNIEDIVAPLVKEKLGL